MASQDGLVLAPGPRGLVAVVESEWALEVVLELRRCLDLTSSTAPTDLAVACALM